MFFPSFFPPPLLPPTVILAPERVSPTKPKNPKRYETFETMRRRRGNFTKSVAGPDRTAFSEVQGNVLAMCHSFTLFCAHV